MSDTSQKTEAPTPKRKREARERGQIAKTPELSAWASVLAVTVLVQLTISQASTRLQDLVATTMQVVAQPDQHSALRLLGEAMKDAGIIVLPLIAGISIVAIGVNLAQVGLKPSTKRLKPDFKRLNAVKGLKRLFSVRSAWETVKAFAKVAILFLVGWPLLRGAAGQIARSGGSLTETVRITGESGLSLIRNTALAGLVLAAVDYLVQKRRINKELRMSRQEIKDEFKQHEGNPQVKQAIRSRQMSISRNRMLASVAGSNVVLVNPTHYAVALTYDAASGAPQVVAKGAGVIAAAIRAEAEEHAVPIVSDPPLTRAIYKLCEIGQQIPPDLYEAVARVLAFVFGLRNRRPGATGGIHHVPGGTRIPAGIAS
ncbi:MAG: EscU/YscU/HrcU family type III secretion system export apparatus switch protein [Acidimicrobiia bacterium]